MQKNCFQQFFNTISFEQYTIPACASTVLREKLFWLQNCSKTQDVNVKFYVKFCYVYVFPAVQLAIHGIFDGMVTVLSKSRIVLVPAIRLGQKAVRKERQFRQMPSVGMKIDPIITLNDSKFIPRKIRQDLYFLQVSCNISIFLASFCKIRIFLTILQDSCKIIAKIFLPNNFLEDSFKTLAYIGHLAINSCFLQVLATNKFSVLQGSPPCAVFRENQGFYFLFLH